MKNLPIILLAASVAPVFAQAPATLSSAAPSQGNLTDSVAPGSPLTEAPALAEPSALAEPPALDGTPSLASPPPPAQHAAPAETPPPDMSPAELPDAVISPDHPVVPDRAVSTPGIPGLLDPETAGVKVTDGSPSIETDSEAAQPEEDPQLPPAEVHVRKGIALLLKLHAIMAEVNSPQTAKHAVAPVVTLSRDMLKWTQGFSSLPLLDDDTRMLYEDQYLPIFRKINTQLKLQGERLASAKYYGSRDLQAALAHLILLLQ